MHKFQANKLQHPKPKKKKKKNKQTSTPVCDDGEILFNLVLLYEYNIINWNDVIGNVIPVI
jgi:hypothetical protein